jgi:hypothetical protein
MTLLPEVESALLDAVHRDQQARNNRAAGRVMRWLRSRQRALLIAVAALVVTGSATAAFTLVGERSAPLSGTVPTGQLPNTAVASGSRYDIHIAPSLTVGEISWCISITTTTRSGRPQDLGTGSCDEGAPTTGEPLFGLHPGAIQLRGLAYLLTGPNVTAVRIPSHQTVLTRPDPRLPYGYRAAVFEITRPTALSQAIALDRSGHQLNDLSGPPAEPTATWLVGQRPARGACSLTLRPGNHAYSGSGSVVTSIAAAPTIAGRAFLPCINTDLYTPGSSGPFAGYLEAAVLLDAAHPGTRPAELPDMHPIGGHPGILDRPGINLPSSELLGPGISAKRVGNAWLVIAGGANTAQRIAALNELNVGPIQLASPQTKPQPPAGALCTIDLRPTAGVQETTQNAITSPHDTRAASFNESQRTITKDAAQLRHDQVSTPHDRQRIEADQVKLALDREAQARLSALDILFPPTCATATFYYQHRWPITATVQLATRTCPGVRIRVPCNTLRPKYQTSIRQALHPVPGQPNEFTVTPLFRHTETVKQLGKAWLIARGGEPAQQQQLLAHLTVTIAPELQHRNHGATSTLLAFCEQEPSECTTTTPRFAPPPLPRTTPIPQVQHTHP